MEDFEKVLQEKDLAFAETVQSKRANTPLLRQYRERVENCRKVSIIPNLISYASVLFLGVWLAGPYTGPTKYVLMIAFFLFAAGWEYAKRYSIMEALDGSYNKKRSYKKAFWLAVPLLIAGSIAGSYTSTDKAIQTQSGGPTLVHNLSIDSLKAVVAQKHEDIAHNKKQTWNGTVVRGARASNKILRESIALLEGQIATLSEDDRLENQGITKEHQAKLVNFGAIGGTIVGLMDVLLFILLWQAEKVETLADMLLKGTVHTENTTPSHKPTGPDNGAQKRTVRNTPKKEERYGKTRASVEDFRTVPISRNVHKVRTCSECDTDISSRDKRAVTCGTTCRKDRKKRLDAQKKSSTRLVG